MGIMYNCAFGLAKIFFRSFYNVKADGHENFPEGDFIIASNHRSNADPPLISIMSGYSRFAFVAKEELFKNKFAGWVIGKFGAFPVTRGKGDTSVIDTSVEKIKEGRKLIIFPEGTRSKTGKIGKGKTGVAVIAAKSGVPVVPAGIIFDGKLRFRSKVTIKYGKPIMPEELSLSKEPTPNELKVIKNTVMNAIISIVEGEQNGN